MDDIEVEDEPPRNSLKPPSTNVTAHSSKGFNSRQNKSPAPLRTPVQNDLTDLLENRKDIMKSEVDNIRKAIPRSPLPPAQLDDDNLDIDPEIEATLKISSQKQAKLPTSGRNSDRESKVNRRIKDIDDEFEGMGERLPEALKDDAAPRPPLIPMARNRIKLQPMNLPNPF